jgi:hypothetical protein
MRHSSAWFDVCVALLVILGMFGARSALAQTVPGENSTDPRIAKLIDALGDDSLVVRQQAEQELVAIGQAAKPLVTAAAKSANLDVSLRAKLILQELSKRRVAVGMKDFSWQTVLDLVKQHAASDAWQEPGFEDELLEAAMGKLVDQVNAAAKEERVKFTPRFARCRPQRNKDGSVKPRELDGDDLLFVGHDSFDLRRGTRSIILVDGNVSMTSAYDCLIIARGAVNIAYGSGNVILAGQYLDIAHDGDRDRPQGGGLERTPGPANLLMSGGDLRVSHALRSVLVAGGPLELMHGSDCILLNRGSDQIEARHGVAVPEAKLSFVPKARPNPLQGKVKITQASNGSSRFAVMDYNGVELVLRLGDEIKDNRGKPIPDFAGWKLEVIDNVLAVFSNGKEDACFALPYQ